MIVNDESIAGNSRRQSGKRVLKRIHKGRGAHKGEYVYMCMYTEHIREFIYNHTVGARTTIQKKKTGLKDAVEPKKGDSDKPKKHQPLSASHKHKQLDLSTSLVKMWEQFRKHKCSNRTEILQNILTIIKGRVKEVRVLLGKPLLWLYKFLHMII